MNTKPLKTVLSKLKQSVATFKGDTTGNLSIIVALTAVPLFGAAGIAIDMNQTKNTIAALQVLADQAAIHGASFPGTAAQKKAAADDFLAKRSPSLSRVSFTPTTTSTADSVAVEIKANIETSLSRFVTGAANIEAPIRSRANRVTFEVTSPCAAAMGASGGGTGISLSGTASITATNCVVHSNSTSTTSGISSSSSAMSSADAFTVVGGAAVTPGTFTPAVKTQQPTLVDPYAGLQTGCAANTPPITATGTSVNASGSTTQTVTQQMISSVSLSGTSDTTFSANNAVILGNISISGSNGKVDFKSTGSVVIAKDLSFSGTGSTINFTTPVVYLFGKLSVSGSAAITATGTTFVLCGANAGLSKSGTGTIQIKAPQTGATKGFAVIGDSTTQNIAMSGSTTSFVRGIWYTPKAAMTFSGDNKFNQNTSNYFPLIVKGITLSGNAGLNIGLDYKKPDPNSNLPADAYDKPDALIKTQNEVYLTAY